MNLKLEYNGTSYVIDTRQPIDISIPLQEGDKNPNCYFAPPPTFETIRTENFVGSVREGGDVNYQTLRLTPHGNGTHTECLGHITSSGLTINKALTNFHFIAELITVKPEMLENGDQVILKNQLEGKLRSTKADAVVIRSLPNDPEKKIKKYSGTNPPYFHYEALKYLREIGISHLLTDLPSVDREQDGGKLLGHKAFWGFNTNQLVTGSTITELIFVENSVEDETYLLNLQVVSLETDATPSKPVLYKLKKA